MRRAKYAVAVRGGTDLLLFRIIKTSPSGIYIHWPIKRFLLYDRPHVSYHASGQINIRTSPRSSALPPRYAQKPDASLVGVEDMVLTPIDARELKKNVIPSRYDEIFVVPLADISPPRHTGAYQAYFALAEPGVSVPLPNLPGHPRLISQWSFKNDVPWIVVTLYEA